MSIKKIFVKYDEFNKKLYQDHITAFSAQGAFFIILSFFPLMIFMLTLVQKFPVYNYVVTSLKNIVFPTYINNFIENEINELAATANGTVLSVSAIFTLWSSSTGMLALMRGLNHIYNHYESRNYFIQRAIACFYTFLLTIMIIISLTILVFGNKIASYIIFTFEMYKDTTIFFMSIRTLISTMVLFVAFTLMFTFLPCKKGKLVNQFPGALIASIGWIIFSYSFSFYLNNFSNYSYIYGSLTAIIILMLWIYFCIYILFIGAEVNQHLIDCKKK